MSKTIVYIAASLDGYIARKDDDLSWLEAFQVPDEDYGYAEFTRNVGCAIMGARTYAESLKHPERLMTGIRNYVLSRKAMPVPTGIEVEFYSRELGGLITTIKKERTGDIFIVGGGQVVSSLLNAGLVDEMLHFVVPVLLGEGIPLYPSVSRQLNLRLIEATAYRTGIVLLHYAPST